MKDISGLGFHMTCPLVEGIIDSDLCIEVQDCIEGSIPITMELEEFLESEEDLDAFRRRIGHEIRL